MERRISGSQKDGGSPWPGRKQTNLSQEKEKVKKEVPLFKKISKRGRSVKYDYSSFLNTSTRYVVLENFDESNYASIRSTLTRWKKINNIEGKFEYDFYPENEEQPKRVVIWRVNGK
jgi:hypothetical protein